MTLVSIRKTLILSLAGCMIAGASFAQMPVLTEEMAAESPAAQGPQSTNVSTSPIAAEDSVIDDRGYLVKVGDPAPDNFKLVLTDGKTLTLQELKGKVVVLQFTASWCSVCRSEMPHLESDVWQAYKDKNLLLIAVDRDQPLDTVIKSKKEMQMTYPFALDPGADIFGRFADKNSGVTRNVVIDRDGKIAFLTRLYTPEEFSAMVKVIDELVNR